MVCPIKGHTKKRHPPREAIHKLSKTCALFADELPTDTVDRAVAVSKLAKVSAVEARLIVSLTQPTTKTEKRKAVQSTMRDCKTWGVEEESIEPTFRAKALAALRLR